MCGTNGHYVRVRIFVYELNAVPKCKPRNLSTTLRHCRLLFTEQSSPVVDVTGGLIQTASGRESGFWNASNEAFGMTGPGGLKGAPAAGRARSGFDDDGRRPG